MTASAQAREGGRMRDAVRAAVDRVRSADPRVVAGGIAVLALLARLAYLAMGGVRVGADTTGYLATCDRLAAGAASPFQGLIGVEYLGFVGPMCLVVQASGGALGAWVGVQILASVAGCVLLYDAGRRLFGPVAGLTAGVALALLWETFQWDLYVLSDTTFTFVLILLVWSLSRLQEAGTAGRKAVVWSVLGYLAITRPLGGPIVAGLLALDLLPPGNRWRLGLSGSRLPSLLVLATIAVVTVGFTARVGWVESNLYEVWSQGLLVHDDPTFRYAYTPAEADSMLGFALLNLHHLVVMGVAKLGLFFLPVVDRFSLVHNVVNVVVLVPVLAGGVAGAVRLVRERDPRARFVLVPLAVILLVVMVTFIDFDWRYRAPAGPLFALLFGSLVDRSASP